MKALINLVSNIKKWLLDIPSLDPDDARRRKLLNILLFGLLAATIMALMVTVIVDITNTYSQEDITSLYFTAFITFLFCGLLLLINRYWSGRLAAFLFLLLTLGIATFVDEPQQVIDGRSLLWYALPVLGGSMLVSPAFSFVMATLSCLAIAGVGFRTQLVPTPIGMICFYIIAVFSWLAANTLERALRDLRILNAELDQRVQQRTQELATALRQVHTMAVQNKTVLESIADGVLVFGANEEVIMANPAASRLARRDLQSFNSTQFLTTIEGKARELIQNWMKGQKPAEINNVRFKWDDRTISANIAPVILPGVSEKPEGAGNVMVLRDFTKEAELEKAKGLFLGMVSHELRTPMSAIQGYVDILLATERGFISEMGYGYLQTIHVSIKQLLKLANELIDMSRMETGEIELYCQWVDLADLVDKSAKIVQHEFESRNLSLAVQCKNSLPNLYVDPNRISQVLLNLLSNAYKYTFKGGATVEVTQSDEWVNVAINDTGIGIKVADQEKLFERFFRASDRAVQRTTGTGLGLSISKGLVELHGGELTFASQYGVGTTFTVRLPKNRATTLDNNFDLPNEDK